MRENDNFAACLRHAGRKQAAPSRGALVTAIAAIAILSRVTAANAQACEDFLSFAPSFDNQCGLHVMVGLNTFNNCGAPLPANLIVRVYLDAASTSGGSNYLSYLTNCDNYLPVWEIGPINIGTRSVVWVEAWKNPGNSGVEFRCPNWAPIAVHVASDAFADPDGDGVQTCFDNCPATHNSNQVDTDSDTLGDACDPQPFAAGGDFDADGAPDASDNCPSVSNPAQEDTDGDGVGDACDPSPNNPSGGADGDGDGVNDNLDNCPLISNPNQADADGDHSGDACDPDPANPYWDADSDAIYNSDDNCPTIANPDQLNYDGDDFGDACDLYPQIAGNPDETVSRSFSVLNRATAVIPGATEKVSRAVSIVNRAQAPSTINEATSRAASVTNRALAAVVINESISRASSLCNAGDLNANGDLETGDIPAFVDVLLGVDTDPGHVASSDLNCDELVNGLDIQPFVTRLLSH